MHRQGIEAGRAATGNGLDPQSSSRNEAVWSFRRRWGSASENLAAGPPADHAAVLGRPRRLRPPTRSSAAKQWANLDLMQLRATLAHAPQPTTNGAPRVAVEAELDATIGRDRNKQLVRGLSPDGPASSALIAAMGMLCLRR